MLFIIIIIFSMPESGVLQDSIFFMPERGCYSLYTITPLQHQKVESFHKKWCCLSDSMSVLCHLLKPAISCLTTFSFTVRSWDSGSNFHQHKYRAEMPAYFFFFFFYIIAKSNRIMANNVTSLTNPHLFSGVSIHEGDQSPGQGQAYSTRLPTAPSPCHCGLHIHLPQSPNKLQR